LIIRFVKPTDVPQFALLINDRTQPPDRIELSALLTAGDAGATE
jgi:hypothetical protein